MISSPFEYKKHDHQRSTLSSLRRLNVIELHQIHSTILTLWLLEVETKIKLLEPIPKF